MLTALLVEEPMTPRVDRLYADDADQVVWWGSELECVSAVARREREGVLTSRGAQAALEKLDALAAAWEEIEPSGGVRRSARRLLRTHPLRAGDSLQLAAAIAASEGDPSSLPFVAFDARLVEAAQREGFPVVEID